MKNIEVGSVGTKRLVVLAQLLTLAALAMGLQFLFNLNYALRGAPEEG